MHTEFRDKISQLIAELHALYQRPGADPGLLSRLEAAQRGRALRLRHRPDPLTAGEPHAL